MTIQSLLFEENFENRNLGNFGILGISPTVTSKLARIGTHCMQSQLGQGETRAEVKMASKIKAVGNEYWYGFSIFLPEPFEVNSAWESVAQWHARPDFDIGETWRSAPMSLTTAHPKSPFPDAEWILPVRWDSRKLSDLPVEGEDWHSLGPYETDVWTDWVFHIKWSYESDGLLEIWKNHVKVLGCGGPNCFNDEYGPYFKMGIYRASRSAGAPRTIYHDEFRMADGNGTYEDVFPGGKPPEPEPEPEPKPPISGTTNIKINIPATQIPVIIDWKSIISDEKV